MTADAAGKYAAQVDAVLARMMPSAYAMGDRPVIVDLIAQHARNPKPAFELIVDDPTSARWRLVANRRRAGTVMLVCHRATVSAADRTTELTVNEALVELVPPARGER